MQNKILLKKQNDEMIFEMYEQGRYPYSLKFTDPKEFKFFGLQLVQYVENKNEFLCLIAYMISDEYKSLSLNISDMFKREPEGLEEKDVLSKVYSDCDWVYNNLSSENNDLIIAMDKIIDLVKFLIESNIIGNLDFGDTLFGLRSEDLFHNIITKDMSDALYDAMERVNNAR